MLSLTGKNAKCLDIIDLFSNQCFCYGNHYSHIGIQLYQLFLQHCGESQNSETSIWMSKLIVATRWRREWAAEIPVKNGLDPRARTKSLGWAGLCLAPGSMLGFGWQVFWDDFAPHLLISWYGQKCRRWKVRQERNLPVCLISYEVISETFQESTNHLLKHHVRAC